MNRRPHLSLAAMRLVLPVLFAAGCSSVPPPLSRVPTGQAAIDRMRAMHVGCNGVRASASLEASRSYALLFKGSVRTDVLLYGALPSRLRLDVVSSFGAVLATMTSDADRFALSDLRERRFYVGSARCGVEHLTGVPAPPHALVAVLRGEAPVLVHDRADIAWSRRGHYVVTVPSTRDATEEILLAPAPADWDRPWTEQRLRVLEVTVTQHGGVLYRVRLAEHAPAPQGGPQCEAELPRALHIEVPERDEAFELRIGDIAWNPPYPDDAFTQAPTPGLAVTSLACF